MILYAILFALIGSFSGLFISYYLNVPSGASVIFTLVIIFALLKLSKTLYIRSKRNNLKLQNTAGKAEV